MAIIDKTAITAAYLGEAPIYKILDGKNNLVFQDVKIETYAKDELIHPPAFAKTASFYIQGAGGGGKGGFAFPTSRSYVGQGGQVGGYREILNQPIEDFWRTEGLQIKIGKGGKGGTPRDVQDSPNGQDGGWTGVKLKKNEGFYAAAGGKGGTEHYVENAYLPDRVNELGQLVCGGSSTIKHVTVPRTFNPTHNIFPATGGKLVYNHTVRGFFRFSSETGDRIIGSVAGLAGGGGSGGSRGGYGKTVVTGGKGGDGWIIVVWIP